VIYGVLAKEYQINLESREKLVAVYGEVIVKYNYSYIFIDI